jgi:hypothetical protein
VIATCDVRVIIGRMDSQTPEGLVETVLGKKLSFPFLESGEQAIRLGIRSNSIGGTKMGRF